MSTKTHQEYALIHSFYLFIYSNETPTCNCRTLYLFHVFYSKIFFFYCYSFCYSSARKCKPSMCRRARQSLLLLSLSLFTSSVCALSIRLFTSINIHFCSTTVAVDEEKHYCFWNTHTAKKETEDNVISTRTFRYF
jgi:hypothetical protein